MNELEVKIYVSPNKLDGLLDRLGTKDYTIRITPRRDPGLLTTTGKRLKGRPRPNGNGNGGVHGYSLINNGDPTVHHRGHPRLSTDVVRFVPPPASNLDLRAHPPQIPLTHQIIDTLRQHGTGTRIASRDLMDEVVAKTSIPRAKVRQAIHTLAYQKRIKARNRQVWVNKSGH